MSTYKTQREILRNRRAEQVCREAIQLLSQPTLKYHWRDLKELREKTKQWMKVAKKQQSYRE